MSPRPGMEPIPHVENGRQRFAVFPSVDPIYVDVEIGLPESTLDRARDLAMGELPDGCEFVAVVPAEWLWIFSRGWISHRIELAKSPDKVELEWVRTVAVTTPHEFVGRHDRPCELCLLPDRADIHKIRRGLANERDTLTN